MLALPNQQQILYEFIFSGVPGSGEGLCHISPPLSVHIFLLSTTCVWIEKVLVQRFLEIRLKIHFGTIGYKKWLSGKNKSVCPFVCFCVIKRKTCLGVLYITFFII